jgi:hypothetical protein
MAHILVIVAPASGSGSTTTVTSGWADTGSTTGDTTGTGRRSHDRSVKKRGSR